jgi:ATP-binding cassette subfamily C protein
MVTLKNELFNAIIKKDYTEFGDKNSANYINVLTSQMKSVETDYFDQYFIIVKNISMMFLSLLAMFVTNWKLASLIIIACILPMIITGILGKKMSKGQKNIIESEMKYTSKVKDMLQGFLIIKSFNVEKQVQTDYSVVNKNIVEANYKNNKLSALTRSVSELSGMLVFLVAFGSGMFMAIKGYTTVGDVTAVVQLVNFVVMPINELGVSMNRFKSSKAVLATLIDDVLVKTNNNEIENLEIKKKFNKVIEFKNVNFSYPGADLKVLNKFNLDIEKGKKYAIVGMSGSGKSTVLNLLLKFFKLSDTDGKILIDKSNINNISVDSIYNLLTIVQQNVYIFDDTLRANITLNQQYSENEIIRAVKLSGLIEFIENSELGLDTPCGENGCLLSGGQKQRISIARSLLRNTPVLLMDEATSSLDRKTTFDIENSILGIKDLTTIIITHKLDESLLDKYDEIIFLKSGTIVEMGTFKELITGKGEFYNLYKAMS